MSVRDTWILFFLVIAFMSNLADITNDEEAWNVLALTSVGIIMLILSLSYVHF